MDVSDLGVDNGLVGVRQSAVRAESGILAAERAPAQGGPKVPCLRRFAMMGWFAKLPTIAGRAALWPDRRGAVAIYVALAGVLVMGSLVLGVDIGRMAVLRAQLQNAADAAALAAATALDGSPGARDRATAIATTTATDSSRMTVLGGDLTVSTVEFFSVYVPGGVQTAATNDVDANFVRVTMSPENIQILFQPVLAVVTDGGTNEELAVNALAVAGNSPIVCNVSPFMVCDFTEDLDLIEQLIAGQHVGRQILLKPQGGGGFVPGNYGLLCVESDCGASAINAALLAIESGACTGDLVETAPGSKTNQVREGINARFDMGSAPNPKRPANNIIDYPRDPDLVGAVILGNGIWNLAAYWAAKHPTVPLPNDLTAGFAQSLGVIASRYQTYLYELGETFDRRGKVAIYPVGVAVQPGFGRIDPPGNVDYDASPVYNLVPVNVGDPNNNDVDGVPNPASLPVDDPTRRVVIAAILLCEGITGHVETSAAGFLYLFITENVPNPPAADVYAEIVGPVTGLTNTTDFHINVRLIE